MELDASVDAKLSSGIESRPLAMAANSDKPVQILLLSSLYPNAEEPSFGIFVEQRLRHLIQDKNVEAVVVAPVPWFPFKNDRFGIYARYARVGKQEDRYGLTIVHPRYLVIPKIGMSVTPITLALAGLKAIRKLAKQGYEFDLVDAHYFYPDGVAAALICKWLNKPLVITARGTDLNTIPGHYLPRLWIRWAAARAKHMITVCESLKNQLLKLGVAKSRVAVLRNGVDLQTFFPADYPQSREKLGLTKRTILSVGYLIPRKGHEIAIRALTELADIELLIVGVGPEEANLKQLAHSLGVVERVRFMGLVPHAQLRHIYSAADALVLASSGEGWANVLLEAMACGTPVIATRVGGTPEVVTCPEAGVLMAQRNSEGLIDAYKKLFENYPSRDATRHFAENFDWKATSQGQFDIFQRVLKTK